MTAETKQESEESNIMVKVWDYFGTEKKRQSHESTPLLQHKEKEKTFYYLAYGSNLASSTFLGRRGIRPLSATNVLCPGQILVFDLDGIPYWEPCFANIREVSQDERLTLHKRIATAGSPENVVKEYMSELDRLVANSNGEVWKNALIGVVYEVTETDYATIIRTEGGGAGYKDVEVDCYVLPKVDEKGNSGPVTTIRAHTLRAPPEKVNQNSTSQPSPRYLNLLVTGAKEHSLPPAYTSYLSSLHGYRRTTWRQKVGGFVFLAQWILPLAMLLNVKNLLSDKKSGKSPTWIQKWETGLFALMWTCYKWVYKPIWGNGQRTIGDDVDFCGRVLGEVTGGDTHTINMSVDTADLGDAFIQAEEAMVDAVRRGSVGK